MCPINGFTCICLIFVIVYGIGLVIFLSDFEENKCEMTYMFEYPKFVKISNKKDEQFIKYGLYAYSEGTLTTKVRSMRFDGIPVLFIPGNRGSYKQVRSLSSVALRKALSLRSYHFDYFTMDFNSELSGVYGPLLYDQLKYIKYSLNRIFELYREGSKPNSIIIIGHSIGPINTTSCDSEDWFRSLTRSPRSKMSQLRARYQEPKPSLPLFPQFLTCSLPR
ncbi:GPI inositol-deacylase [Anoplophora glabripennis]|uniref:GPI inositol-deacylase n=1 Tax=Anoplophora glabripennis TaxID=217634 RepID=UPI000C76C36F|nr:GPI inositol-deacylase [Anoplophora glabripennis]